MPWSWSHCALCRLSYPIQSAIAMAKLLAVASIVPAVRVYYRIRLEILWRLR
jgi:hypothetical protein